MVRTARDGSIQNVPCTKCHRVLTLDHFYTYTITTGKVKYKSECKECYAKLNKERAAKLHPLGMKRSKLYSITSNYGLTPEQVEKMLTDQNFSCKICERSFDEKGGTRLVVDHCHDTNKVRGIICHDCNVGIARLGDTAEGLRKALRYLEDV